MVYFYSAFVAHYILTRMILSPQRKTNAVKEKIRKKYEDMKRVLDEDLRITLTQLDTEHEATERLVEERMEDCYHLTQELDRELSNAGAQMKPQEADIQVNIQKVLISCNLSGIKSAVSSCHSEAPRWVMILVSYRIPTQKKGMFTFREETAHLMCVRCMWAHAVEKEA